VSGGYDTDAQPEGTDVSGLLATLVERPGRATTQELRSLREHVIARALTQPIQVPAPAEIHGFRVGRRMIRVGDPIDVRYAKYLLHVIDQEQWPSGTTFEEFVQSLINVVRSDESGVFADRRGARWVLTFVDRSGIWEGVAGGPYVVRPLRGGA
jgi:hypothetical protein